MRRSTHTTRCFQCSWKYSEMTHVYEWVNKQRNRQEEQSNSNIFVIHGYIWLKTKKLPNNSTLTTPCHLHTISHHTRVTSVVVKWHTSMSLTKHVYLLSDKNWKREHLQRLLDKLQHTIDWYKISENFQSRTLCVMSQLDVFRSVGWDDALLNM